MPQLANKHLKISQRLGYVFNNPTILEQALTHRSASAKHNYERLEFLGDAFLNGIIAEYLFNTFPADNEGKLTRMRSSLVREDTLVLIAKHLEVGDALILSSGEYKSGGHNRPSILADAVEALIGAIWLDSKDRSLLQQVVMGWYTPLLHIIEPGQVLKDPKSRLQEHLQAQHLPLPVYSLLSVQGDAPKQVFTVSCQLAGHNDNPDATVASGASRRFAEQQAAADMLSKLNL